MDIYFVVTAVSLLFFFELLYFKVANKYNIIDSPNNRSSHTHVTIRGGGVIFCLSILLAAVFRFSDGYFIAGLLIVAVVSFIDDVKPLSNKLRLTAHLVAVSLLFYQINGFDTPVLWAFVGYIVVIGIINAVNFMDGINGITGGYGLVALFTLYYLNTRILFTNSFYLMAAICSALVFCFFNFRSRAKCFAGDVGSISLAFIIVFFQLKLIFVTQNPLYLFILMLYGLDSITTILFRLIRRENIFKAHRSHFYQFLANEKQIPHLLVSLLYMAIQGIINILLLNTLLFSVVNVITFFLAVTFVFIFFRLMLEGKDKLLKRSSDF